MISFWNIRSFNMPLKKSGVLKYLRRNRVAIMGILETNLNHQIVNWFARNKFLGWRMADNFSHHPNGRILIVWKEDLVQLDVVQTTDQAIHCLTTCKSSAVTFYISFIYAFNTPVGRRPLWHNLHRFSYASQNPWIFLGDFNNVLSSEERINGQPVSLYETCEFKACCYNLGLSNMRSSGFFNTWTNNKIC